MINSFFGEYRFLSNFWLVQVRFDGELYSSVEHAYVAAKTTDPVQRELIRNVSEPGKVKRLGRKITLRPDWEVIKLNVMAVLIDQKFNMPDLAEKLLSTGDEELVEGNNWGDTYWGVCRGQGANNLGKLLMAKREALKGA